MLYEFFLFFPSSVCLLFSMMLAFKHKKNKTQNLLMWVLLLAVPAALGDALYFANETNYYVLFTTDTLSAVTTPIIPFIGYLLLRTINGSRLPMRMSITVLIVMSIYTSMLLMSVLLAGVDNLLNLQSALVAEGETFDLFTGVKGADSLPEGYRTSVYCFYLILTRPLYFSLILIGIVSLLGYIVKKCIDFKVPHGQFFKFLFRGGLISSFYLVAILIVMYAAWGVLRIIIGIDAFRANPILTVVYSIFLSAIFYFFGSAAKHFPAQVFSLRTLSQQYSFEVKSSSSDTEEEVQEPTGNVAITQKTRRPSTALPDDAEKMLRALKRLMEDEQLFLNPDLTIEDVAAELSTNRVYISRVVNQLMHETFRDYVNRLRIKYAKQYMHQNPAHTQEAVANASGYQDAASFNRKFRQLTGMTPREWANYEAERAARYAQRAAQKEEAATAPSEEQVAPNAEANA